MYLMGEFGVFYGTQTMDMAGFIFFDRQNICTRHKFQKGTKGLTMSVKSLFQSLNHPAPLFGDNYFNHLPMYPLRDSTPPPQQMVAYHAKCSTACSLFLHFNKDT